MLFCSDGPNIASISSGSRAMDDQPPAAETQKFIQPPPARPRPDHLPLGSSDPRAHPLVLGVASLTGGLVCQLHFLFKSNDNPSVIVNTNHGKVGEVWNNCNTTAINKMFKLTVTGL